MSNNRSFGDSDLQYYLRTRDNKSFEKLVEHYYRMIYLFALKEVKDDQSAASIANETFAKFYRANPPLEHLKALLAYLFTTARRLCIDHLSRERKNSTKALDATVENLPADLDMTDDTAYAEMRQALWEPIQCLPRQQRKILELLLYEGLDIAEAAKAMNISEQTARNQKARAINKLRGMPLTKRLLSLLCIFLDNIQ